MDSYPVHEPTFAGYRVVEWKSDLLLLENAAETAIAIRTQWDDKASTDTWIETFEAFLSRDYARHVPALLVGMWGWQYEERVDPVIRAIAANHDKLPRLRALFVGDIVSEENEISWIRQGDLSPVWTAFSDLEHLTIRGGDGLSLGQIRLLRLKSLRIESGGLNASVVQAVGAAHWPELESLVLWLGTANYGGTTTIKDLTAFYHCANMPKLQYLGLCDSEITDEIAEFIATAPVLQRLGTLDLSMGTLSDQGALALLTSPYIGKVKNLNISHHYCSDAMIEKLEAQMKQAGVALDASDKQEDEEDWRFVAVSE